MQPQYVIPGVGLTTNPGQYGYTAETAQLYTPPTQAQAPTNAAAITQAPAPKVTTPTPSYGNPAPANAAAAGAQKQIDLQIQADKDAADAKAKSDALTASNTQAKGYLSSLMTSNPSIDARNTAQGQTGIVPANYFADQQARIAEIGKLNEDYNKTKAQMDAEVEAARQNSGGALTSGVNADVSRIQKFYATQLSQKSADINAKSAVLTALQGNFAESEKFVTQYVNDATADYQYKVDALKTFITQNDTEISKLDSKYQDAITTSYNVSKDELNNARNVANDKIDNDLKAAQTRVANANANALTGGVKLTPTQLNSGASSLGISTEEYKKLDAPIQTFFTSAGGKTFISSLKDIQDGKSTYDEVKSSIDVSIQPQSVKDYMQKVLDKEYPQDNTPGVFDKIGSFFSSLFK